MLTLPGGGGACRDGFRAAALPMCFLGAVMSIGAAPHAVPPGLDIGSQDSGVAVEFQP